MWEGSSISLLTTAVDILLEHGVALHMAVCCQAMGLDCRIHLIPSFGGKSEAMDLRMVRFSCLSWAFSSEITVL